MVFNAPRRFVYFNRRVSENQVNLSVMPPLWRRDIGRAISFKLCSASLRRDVLASVSTVLGNLQSGNFSQILESPLTSAFAHDHNGCPQSCHDTDAFQSPRFFRPSDNGATLNNGRNSPFFY